MSSSRDIQIPLVQLSKLFNLINPDTPDDLRPHEMSEEVWQAFKTREDFNYAGTENVTKARGWCIGLMSDMIKEQEKEEQRYRITLAMDNLLKAMDNAINKDED